MSPIDVRRTRYFQLSSRSAQLDNATLRSMLGAESGSSAGWGRKHTIELGGTKVFVKRVPLTDIEHENLFSTRNLYGLPTYYNYGFGSAGFGAFRELVSHIKTTNWVLDGAIAGFPLLYHYRIVPFWGARAEVDMERHNRSVEYWGGSANVGRYLLDRESAHHEMVLFLEHIPHTLTPWLRQHSDQTPRILDDLRGTISFLRKQGILHLDADASNILTDGAQTYLTDFGLALDRTFALAEDEQMFFSRHTLYDYGEMLCSLASLVLPEYEALPESEKLRVMERYGMRAGMPPWELGPILLNNIEQMHSDGLLKLDRAYVATIHRYRSIVALMVDFYANMLRNSRKDTEFRHAELQRLLEQTGFLRSDVDSAG